MTYPDRMIKLLRRLAGTRHADPTGWSAADADAWIRTWDDVDEIARVAVEPVDE